MAAYGIGHYFTDYYAAPDSTGYKVSLKLNGVTLYAVTTPPGFANHKAASWSAVYNYYYTDSWWKNTASMKAQYECHYSWCPNDTTSGTGCYTWELETWRTGTPNPIPVEFGGNACNPD